MKKNYLLLFALCLCGLMGNAQYPALNFTLISTISPETGVNNSGDKYSGCWGWHQAAKNKEYAIACSKSGTYWVDITNPATPTVSSFKPGTYTNATWREVKTYQNYCYVISDDGGTGPNNSFQIFDMQYLPDSVSKIYDSKSLFKRGHALWIDGSRMYISSVTYSNNTYSSLNVYSLANPASPVLLRRLDQDYPFITGVHDSYARNDTVYASCENQGLYVFKFTGTNFQQLGSLTSYPFSGYNHSSALTPNGQTLVFADELPNGLPLKVANVSNLSNIQVVATTNQFPQTTPHNPFVVSNQYCFMASYEEGVQLYDISSPSSPTLAGYFDTHYQSGGNTGTWTNWKGVWGAYPFFPSKVIFALDMNNGIFLLKTSLYANPQVTTGFTHTPVYCAGATMSLTNNSTGATNYTWTFSGATPSTSAMNPTVSFSAPGVHTITLLATNPSFSSSTTTTLNIPGNNNIISAITTTNASCNVCNTGVASLSLSGGVAPYTVTWTPSGANALTVSTLTPGCYTVSIRDAAKCVNSASTCIGFFTGIGELTENGNVRIYPNPARQQVTVDFPGAFDCRIYDLSGKLVLTKNANHETTSLRTDKLVPGIYFLEVENGSEKSRKKLVIE